MAPGPDESKDEGGAEFATVLQSILIDESNPARHRHGGQVHTGVELCGDYYECLQTGDKTWLLIADVSGHGVASAMIASMIKVMFQNLLNYIPPGHILAKYECDLLQLTIYAYYSNGLSGLIEDGVFTIAMV